MRAAAILGLALAAALASAARAQEASPVSLSAELGFAGEVRSGHPMPLHLGLERKNTVLRPGDPEVLTGELEIRVTGANGYVDVDTVPGIALAPDASRRLDRVVPYGATVRVAFRAGGRELAFAEAAPNSSVIDRDRLAVTLSGRGAWLGFLEDTALGRTAPEEADPSGGALAALQKGRLHVAAAALDALPAHPAGWGGVDLVLIGDLGDARPAAARAEALMGWLRAGGRALVIGGVHDLHRRGSAWERLLPGEAGDTAEASFPAAFAAALETPGLAGLRVVARRWSGARGRVPFAPAGDEPPVVVRRAFGWGEVLQLNFDPTVPPLRGHPLETAFWEGLSRWALKDSHPESPEALWAGAGDEARLDPPKARWVIAFTLLYALLVGPVNYFALRALGRERWLWVTTPGLALLFFSGSVQLDRRAIDRPMVVRQLSVVWLSDDPDAPAEWSTWLDFFSSTRTEVTVHLPGEETFVSDADATAASPPDWATTFDRRDTPEGRELRFEVEKWARRRLVLRGRGTTPIAIAVDESTPGRPRATISAPAPVRHAFALRDGAVAHAAELPPDAPWDWTLAADQGAAQDWAAWELGPRAFGARIGAQDAPLWTVFHADVRPRTPLDRDANGALGFLVDAAPEEIGIDGPPAARTVRTLVLRRFPDPPLAGGGR